MQQGDKVAIVTEASIGIVQASANALHRPDSASSAPGPARRRKCQRRIAMTTCDVTDDASVKKAVEKVLGTTGRIDVLVNNAGIGLLGGAEESSIEQVPALFDVTLFGVMRATIAVLPTMRDQKAGRIINISSVLGLISAPFPALNSSTKHALEGYSESLDHEVRSFGIRVCLLEPGYTRTSFAEHRARRSALDAYVSA
jgi:NAD(P)-dependent dehydrogenase (short-subunit alcohol dehydrogenase family)